MMTHAYQEAGNLIAVGALVVAAMLIKSQLKRVGIPEVVDFLLLGFGFQWVAGGMELLDDQALWVLEFLASVGVVLLLFRVGLEAIWRGSRSSS